MEVYKKRKIYEKLGAVWFQKVVFKVEDLKYKFIDKFCPNINIWYNEKCEKKANELCSKTNDELEKKQIRFNYNCKKMRFRQEILEKKNRNYHMNLNNASSFNNYLLWNKKVHKNGIMFNVISLLGCAILLPMASGVWLGLGWGYLGYNLISLGVNFQCVNLQNYNICRFEEKKEALEKLEKRKKDSDAKKYAVVGEKIYKRLENSVELPRTNEVVQSLTTLEELEQLRALALEVQRQTMRDDSSLEKAKVNIKK